MTPEHEQAYLRAIETRSENPIFQLLVQLATSVPDIRSRVRPDAVLFLATNMADMVVGPLTASQAGLPLSVDGVTIELLDVLQSDTFSIMWAAQEIAHLRGRDYISATSVLMATAQVLPALRVNDFKLWGRSPTDKLRF